ncbi:hypothetical protein C8R46DRAFT_1219287 [Mycena filopes]|nr:hypothetical protein C8R46DRAFT_1219287 [Mycena filopes]
MAIIPKHNRPRPFARSTLLRPIRDLRLARCDPLNRWVGSADLGPFPELSFADPLPKNFVMCQLFVARMGNEDKDDDVYILTMRAYEPRAGSTALIRLARFQGSPGDTDAPLWTRRLVPGNLLRFAQPRAFMARLVGGLTDISVRENIYNGGAEITPGMRTWASVAAIGTRARKLLVRLCRSMGKSWKRGVNSNLRAL